MDEELEKLLYKKRGRPSRKNEVVRVNFHLDKDLFDKLQESKGELSTTEYLNKIIRKGLES